VTRNVKFAELGQLSSGCAGASQYVKQHGK
jgi:hypothetical protein